MDITPTSTPAAPNTRAITEGVSAVIAQIQALPAVDELTLGDAEAVRAARAAYDALDMDALTDEDKAALAETETTLAAAEAKIAELQTPVLEIPEETCTVDYSVRQSDSVSYDGHTKNAEGVYVFNYTIHDGASENVVIDLAQCALDLWENDSQVPGDSYKFQISIKNESGREYTYKNNSFVLAPEDTSPYGSLEEGSLFPFLTYDGQYMPIRLSSAMIPLYFYEDVFGVTKDSKVTFEMMCQIYDKLEDVGYTGETAISDYLLDYFNEQWNTNYNSMIELVAEHPNWKDGVDRAFNGIYPMSEETLKSYVAKYPWIDRFLYVQQSGNLLKVQIKWPEPDMAVSSYNSFYMGLFSVVYGKENAESLNPNGTGVEFSRAHGVGDYLPGTALYEETNQYFASLTADGLKSGETLEIWSGYGIDGPGMGNSYQNYSFTYYNVIELEEVIKTGSITGTVFNDEDRDNVFDRDEATFANQTLTLWRQDESGAWVDTERTATTNENGVYTFDDVEEGTYQVQLSGRPSGMNRDCGLSDDAQGNKFEAENGYYATGALTVTAGETTTANAGFYYRSSGGGGGGGTPTTPIEDEDVPLAPGLNRDDHYAYIVGYPEDYVTGEPTDDMSRWPVKPQDNISREEVATIFFRLLDDASRAEAWTTSNSFPDVASDRWSNNAISTAENAGIISGYTDGSFRPGNKITRAEFATIAAQFDDLDYDGEDMFSDISGHWANQYINRAAKKGWIHGYPDGTFRPDQYITRAEAMTLINAVLERVPDADHMLDDMNKWPDNMNTSAWYYAQVQEATNSHDYEDRTDPTESEVWTEIIPTRDWKALEDPSNYEYLESDAGDVM